jgi:hypothetical protein
VLSFPAARAYGVHGAHRPKSNDPGADDRMPKDRAIFQDEQGRSWLVEIQFGHPSPAELGIYAARFQCPEDPDEPVRVGFLLQDDVERGDEEGLREALAESEPADAIG